MPLAAGGTTTGVPGKKTTAAACEKASSELEHQFQRIFAERHRTGQLDLEAVEMAIRSTVHQTGATALTELLRFQPPNDDHRTVPCACGHAANYEGMRSRPILTAVAGHVSTALTICAPNATADSFPPTSNSTSRRRISPPACGACWQPLEARRRLLKVGNNSTCWRIWRSLPRRSRGSPNQSERTLRPGSNKTSGVPSSLISRSSPAHRSPICTYRWMGRSCLW